MANVAGFGGSEAQPLPPCSFKTNKCVFYYLCNSVILAMIRSYVLLHIKYSSIQRSSLWVICMPRLRRHRKSVKGFNMNCKLYEIHDADLAEFCRAGKLFSLFVNLFPCPRKVLGYLTLSTFGASLDPERTGVQYPLALQNK